MKIYSQNIRNNIINLQAIAFQQTPAIRAIADVLL